MSEDLGQRDINVEISQVLSQVVTDSAGDFKVAFTSGATVTDDTVGMWDTSNLRFNIPESGYYDVFGRINFGSGVDDGSNIGVSILKNGSGIVNNLIGGTNGNTNQLTLAKPGLYFSKGDYIELHGYWNDTVSTGSVTVTGATFSATKRSSPQTILETETVAVIATDASGQNLNKTPLTWDTVEEDTHGALSSGVFTAPVSGFYQVEAQVLTSSSSYTVGNNNRLELQKNGTTVRRFIERIENTATLAMEIAGSSL
jgi:hypothetical protein